MYLSILNFIVCSLDKELRIELLDQIAGLFVVSVEISEYVIFHSDVMVFKQAQVFFKHKPSSQLEIATVFFSFSCHGVSVSGPSD